MANALAYGATVIDAGGGGSSSGGHVIQNANGLDMAQRTNLQFGKYLKTTDDSTNDKTVVEDNVEEITWEAYQELTDVQREGRHFIIVDAPDVDLDASNIEYDNTESGLSATKVQSAIDEIVNKLFLMTHPVGSIYMSVDSTNPETLYGGTWVAWGSGRVSVGVDVNDTDFDTAEETGGVKDVTLTSAQSGVPAHKHSVGAHSHGLNNHTHSFSGVTGDNFVAMSYDGSTSQNVATIAGSVFLLNKSSNSKVTMANSNHNHSFSGTTNPATGSTANSNAFDSGNNTATNATEAHTNLQPYITCYMWKRTA